MLIIQRIEEMCNLYKDARYTVGEFLLKEKRNLNKFSMQEIANLTYTSRSTLVRVAQSLGYSGWNEFLRAYKDETTYFDAHCSDADVNYPFHKDDSFIQIAGLINAVKEDSAMQTLDLLHEDSLRQSAMLLKASDRIALYGVSINATLGQVFKRKMLQINKHIEIVPQSEMKYHCYGLTDNNCAILISYSGNDENRMPTSLLPILQSNQVPVIALTSMGNNLLRKEATAVLTIASQEKLYSKIASYATENSIMLLLDVLYSCYFSLDYDYNLEYKTNLSRKIEKNRYSTLESLKEELQ